MFFTLSCCYEIAISEARSLPMEHCHYALIRLCNFGLATIVISFSPITQHS